MPDLIESKQSEVVRVTGGDEQYVADVVLEDNVKRLATTAKVTVQALLAFDDFADTWFRILTAGSLEDTWRIQIAASTIDSTTPDRDQPAVDVTVTVTALQVGDEYKLRDLIISSLNANSNFNTNWKATVVQDNAMVHISSKHIGDEGERPNIGDFLITTTGTATFTYIDDENRKIVRRGKANSGIRDPRDKRFVTFGISGEVQSVPGAVGDLFITNGLAGASQSLLVNGSVTPVNFFINAEVDKDLFIQELRFYGNGNGIKFGQFLSQNSILTNGILIEIRSDENVTILPVIKSTDDFKHKFSFGQGSGFQLNIQAGRDDFMASFNFETTFPIRKAGTFISGDDYIKVSVRDNLTTNLILLEFMSRGFKKEV